MSYGTLTLDPAGAWIMDAVPPHVRIRLKHMFPRIPKTKPPPYIFPADPAHAADLDWFLSRYPMAMSDADRDRLARGRAAHETAHAAREAILRPDWSPPASVSLRSGEALRTYQAQAVEMLAARRSLLVGDEVGLGKTLIGIGACLLPEALRAFIVVEGHLQRQWAEKIEQFTTLKPHLVTTTRPHRLPPADVYLFRYSNIFGWTDTFHHLDVGLAAWDEIQQLRRGTASAKGIVSHALARQARYRLGLTATPIYNYGAEIFNILQFIDEGVLGGPNDFYREWCREGRGLTDPDALGTYLRDAHVFLRRTRRDVGRELPPVNRIVEHVDADQQSLHAVDDIAHDLAMRGTSSPDFTERGMAMRELDLRVRHATGVAKAEGVAAFVRVLLEAGEPVVLVGWHRDVYDIWLDRLAAFKPAMYTGSETNAGKARSAAAFIAGETDLLILSLRSGAGLDGLQERARTVVFGELDWSPGIHHQVIGRLDRDRSDGTREPVMAVFLVTDDGSDPPMMDVLGLKASQAQAVVDPGLGVVAVASDESRLKALAQRYLDKRRDAA